MKIKEIINQSYINKINIAVVVMLAILFSILGYLTYTAGEYFLVQANKLEARIIAQHVIKDVQYIIYEYKEAAKNYNVMCSNYIQLNIKERRNVITALSKQILEDIDVVDGLCAEFDANQLDGENKKYLIYSERISVDSIVTVDKLDDAQMTALYPVDETPKEVKVVGPYQWIDDTSTTSCITLWQGLYDSTDSRIGATYLDIYCERYHKRVSEIVEKYKCIFFLIQQKKDAYIYHPDFEKIGTCLCEDKDNMFDSSVLQTFNNPIECSFDVFDNKRNKKYLINIIPVDLHQGNAKFNFIVAFDHNDIIKNTNNFKTKVTSLFIVSYIILAGIIFALGHYVKRKYFNAEIILIENMESKNES
jgi:hypothetical protein